MKSSLKNMILSLLIITLVAGVCIGLVYNMTKGPIEQAKQAKTTGALSSVIEGFDNDPSEGSQVLELDGMPIKVYTGTKNGSVSGYAVETMTKSGFNGEVKMMVGFKPDGEIYNIEVLEQNETPGLGSKMEDEGNPLLLSLTGKNPVQMKMSVRNDGGDVNAITAATISSRAYVDAVARAYRAYEAVAQGGDTKVDYVAAVFADYDNVSEPTTVDVNDTPATISEVTAGDTLVGYAVRAESAKGYNGTIRLMVGLLPDGTIHNIAVMEQNETAGLGSKITEENAILTSLRGRKVQDTAMNLAGHGGEVDGIAGATVTSEAYVEAVKNAYAALESFKAWRTDNE